MKIITLITLIICLSSSSFTIKLKKGFDFNFGKFAQDLNNGSKNLYYKIFS
jgi:hypothetical protein